MRPPWFADAPSVWLLWRSTWFFNVLTLYPASLPVLKTIMCSLWLSVVVSLGSPKGAPKELPSVPTFRGD